ncbi:uncharacterized protein [Triticum aestivum]|uniref:uncharacterized protein n=1 Tax=Triticum aestivum TaxID=4565 RepID=UPI001D0342E0|nr:uncharacterized protein LOC123099693 [Triticum aestivum]
MNVVVHVVSARPAPRGHAQEARCPRLRPLCQDIGVGDHHHAGSDRLLPRRPPAIPNDSGASAAPKPTPGLLVPSRELRRPVDPRPHRTSFLRIRPRRRQALPPPPRQVLPACCLLCITPVHLASSASRCPLLLHARRTTSAKSPRPRVDQSSASLDERHSPREASSTSLAAQAQRAFPRPNVSSPSLFLCRAS